MNPAAVAILLSVILQIPGTMSATCGPVCYKECPYGHKHGSDGCPICTCERCPPGVREFECSYSLCDKRNCPMYNRYNSPVCVLNVCGGCTAQWWEGLKAINCNVPPARSGVQAFLALFSRARGRG